MPEATNTTQHAPTKGPFFGKNGTVKPTIASLREARHEDSIRALAAMDDDEVMKLYSKMGARGRVFHKGVTKMLEARLKAKSDAINSKKYNNSRHH